MNARLLDVFHDAGNERVLAIAQAIHIHLDRAGEIAVDQQRPALGDDELRRPVERRGKALDVAVHLAAVGDDLHGAPAENVGRTDHDRIADLVGDGARFGR